MHLSRRQLLENLSGLALAAALGAASLRGRKAALTVIEFDRRLRDIIDPTVQADVLANGFLWSEGPVWDARRGRLYFSDVPANIVFSWSEGEGLQSFLDPAGIPESETKGLQQGGSNGLWISRSGELLICSHGKRAVEAMDIDTNARRSLVSRFQDKRFNSPNDLVEASNGDIYFTDPPYGLYGLNGSQLKELDTNGVYRLSPNGELALVTDQMSLPNGIILTEDEQFLLVSQSDPKAPLIRKIGIGQKKSDSVWFDAAPYLTYGSGWPDGMALAEGNTVFATGPGGVWILTADGTPLGLLQLDRKAANCAFGEDGRSLFITATDQLLRIRTKVYALGTGTRE